MTLFLYIRQWAQAGGRRQHQGMVDYYRPSHAAGFADRSDQDVRRSSFADGKLSMETTCSPTPPAASADAA
jgi:hypothetical protein